MQNTLFWLVVKCKSCQGDFNTGSTKWAIMEKGGDTQFTSYCLAISMQVSPFKNNFKLNPYFLTSFASIGFIRAILRYREVFIFSF
jgi:hypothetical protein